MKQLSQLAAVTVLSLGAASGQLQLLAPKIEFPQDSPVRLLSADFSKSPAPLARGGMYIVEVRAVLKLQNASPRRIRGIALAAYAQDVSAKLSFDTPGLNMGPGEVITVPLNKRLTRPIGGVNGPSLEVKLDGVLFDDLSFYGTDAQAQYSLTKWEMEARREREHLKTLLAKNGAEGLRKEMLALAAQVNRGPSPGVQVVRGRITNQEAEREVQFAFTQMPESPVAAVDGTARVSRNEARAPRFTFRNVSKRPVERLEIGWIVKDQQGREFYAASMPVNLKLAPNQSRMYRQNNSLRFDQPVAIQSVKGYVAGVEYADGGQWIPSREALNGSLRGLVPSSPEETRLLEIYTRKGLDALVEELKKF